MSWFVPMHSINDWYNGVFLLPVMGQMFISIWYLSLCLDFYRAGDWYHNKILVNYEVRFMQRLALEEYYYSDDDGANWTMVQKYQPQYCH